MNEKFLIKIKKRIEKMPARTEFELSNIYYDIRINNRPSIQSFGKFFKKKVLEERVENVSYVERTSDNHAHYIKT